MAGPAILGFIAQHQSLEVAFLFIACLLTAALINQLWMRRHLAA